MSAVNWAEVVGKLANSGMPFSLAASMVDSLPVTLHPFTHDHARLTAELAPATKPLGLSLGDRACLALGLFTGWPVLTADRKWDGVDSKVAIEFIR
jgi:ribonuclease VapC